MLLVPRAQARYEVFRCRVHMRTGCQVQTKALRVDAQEKHSQSRACACQGRWRYLSSRAEGYDTDLAAPKLPRVPTTSPLPSRDRCPTVGHGGTRTTATWKAKWELIKRASVIFPPRAPHRQRPCRWDLEPWRSDAGGEIKARRAAGQVPSTLSHKVT